MIENKNYHMSGEQFVKNGKEVLDWIVDYYKHIESFPVMSRISPGEIRAQLPKNPPQKGESFQDMLADVEKIILPGITHWQSPDFFAFFPANASGPAILGELLSAGLGVQGMIWATSPACTELETHVLDWLADMLALPEKFKSDGSGGGVIQDTASSASLVALLAAREKTTGYLSNKEGAGRNLVAYASTQAHSSIEKAVKIAGLGTDNLRFVGVDENFAMQPQLLSRLIEEDKKAGKIPCFVCATVGTTSSNAMDPLTDIGAICSEYDIWLHVDAAMSGTATLCPEFRYLQQGLEYADSYCFNPHKWMFTNFDCDCFYVADRNVLIRTLSILPEYLKNKATESGAVIDYRDWQIALGRRFRSLKLWFVIRHYGIEGLQYHVRKHVKMAKQFSRWIDQDDNFELAAPVPLNLVCFRHKKGDAFNEMLEERLNAGGKLYLTHTKLNNQYTLRICIGQTNTEPRHVEKAWKLIREAANEVSKDQRSKIKD
jgi:aromatic-L-amino-acid decarboxylase